MLITPAQARAYVNHGRWIADCPLECGSALQLQPKQPTYHCPECQWVGGVEWPDSADEILETLNLRQVPRTRNWYPAGHFLALRQGAPHGQTVKELIAEQEENEGGQ